MYSYHTSKYSKLLDQVNHLKNFPKMKPFVGENYESPSHSKLLIIGESGYFPPYSTRHRNPELWYNDTQSNLNEEECAYLDWAVLLCSTWDQHGHEMYRELNRCLKEVLDTTEDRAVSHVAYTNAYYRPASTPGESIKHCCTELDREQSVKITSQVIDTLKPDIVIFISKYTWDSVGWQIAKLHPEVTMDFTAHAADRRWFYRKNYAHNKDKFIALLQQHFLKNSTSTTPH